MPKFGQINKLMALQIAAISRGYGVTAGNATTTTAGGIVAKGWVILAAGQYNTIAGQLDKTGRWHISITHNGGAAMAIVDGIIANVDKRVHIHMAGATIRINAGKTGRPAMLARSPKGKRYIILIQNSDMANMVAPIVSQIAGL